MCCMHSSQVFHLTCHRVVLIVRLSDEIGSHTYKSGVLQLPSIVSLGMWSGFSLGFKLVAMCFFFLPFKLYPTSFFLCHIIFVLSREMKHLRPNSGLLWTGLDIPGGPECHASEVSRGRRAVLCIRLIGNPLGPLCQLESGGLIWSGLIRG